MIRSNDRHTQNNSSQSSEHVPEWYALRCTYGREKKAYDYLCANGIEAYYPTIPSFRRIDGKPEKVEKSRLPNILFAYSTFNRLKEFVYDNYHDETKYMRFYYNHHHDGTKEPLVIPQRQMLSLIKICEADAEDKLIEPFVVDKFKTGQTVRVKAGPFAGVEGVVDRYKGQQRIGVVVEGFLTVMTAYVAKQNLEIINRTV